MSEPDDWAPLPEDQRAAHSGELLDVPVRPPRTLAPAPATPVRPAAAPTTPSPVAPREPDPEAERALAALKRRIAAAKPATSWIAEMQHREQRAERRRRAANMGEPSVVAATDQTVDVADQAVCADATPPAIDAASDIDPREAEPWFRDLPRSEQERLRTHWWYDRHRNDDAGTKVRRRLRRAFVYGASLFFVMGLLQSLLMGGFGLVPALTAVGGVAAVLAEAAGGGRFVYSAAGAIAFVVVMGATVLLQPFALMSLLMASYGMGTLGMDGEMRRSGGFGDE
ncbi:MAG: hypothetical protein ABIP94_25090 [Planctomycetota bacterium]